MPAPFERYCQKQRRVLGSATLQERRRFGCGTCNGQFGRNWKTYSVGEQFRTA